MTTPPWWWEKVLVYYLFYWLHSLLTVCGDVDLNPGPGPDKRVRVLYSNIRGLLANLDELAVAGSDYDVLVCAESKVSDRRHLSVLHIPRVGCPQQRLLRSAAFAKQSLSRVWLYLLGKDSASSSRESWSVLAMNHESCVFRICSRINNFCVYDFYHNPGQDGSLYDCLLDLMARVVS